MVVAMLRMLIIGCVVVFSACGGNGTPDTDRHAISQAGVSQDTSASRIHASLPERDRALLASSAMESDAGTSDADDVDEPAPADTSVVSDIAVTLHTARSADSSVTANLMAAANSSVTADMVTAVDTLVIDSLVDTAYSTHEEAANFLSAGPSADEIPPASPPESANTIISRSQDRLVLVLAAALFLTLATIAAGAWTMLHWRRSVSGGMEAVVPSLLEGNIANSVKQQIDSLRQVQELTHGRIAQVLQEVQSEHIQLQESVSLLKAELDRKDADARVIRKLLESSERESFLRKTVKLAGFVDSLDARLKDGSMSAENTLDFLSDEVRDTLTEFGVTSHLPTTGAELPAERAELFEVVGTIDEDSGPEGVPCVQVVDKVLSRAYARNGVGGDVTVFQKSRVILRNVRSTE